MLFRSVGWVVTLTPDASGRRRKVRAWIFTPNVSRYRFVYPCDDETTASAIEACEAAWLVGALLSVRRLSLVATAPMLDGVIGSLPADAWDAAWLDGGPPPSAAMAPSVTLEVRLPSALSAGTTAVGFADAAGSDEMVVSGISISP